MSQKVVSDCAAHTVALLPLTTAEQAAYDAAQPAGIADGQARSALLALQAQHQAALGGIHGALTSNPATVQADITAIQALAAALAAGTQPTQADVLHLLRFLLRTLAIQAKT